MSVAIRKHKGQMPKVKEDINHMSDNLKPKESKTSGSAKEKDSLQSKPSSSDKHVGFGKGRRYK